MAIHFYELVLSKLISEIDDINKKIDARRALLHCAVMNPDGYEAAIAVKILIKNKADRMAKGIAGLTPFQWAVNRRNPNLTFKLKPINELIAAGISEDIQSWRDSETGEGFLHKVLFGVLPFSLEERSDYIDTACLLIENGFNINIVNKEGETALHLAVNKSDYKVVELLLKHGADPCEQNKKGKSALDIARKKEDRKLIEVLQAAVGKSQIASSIDNKQGSARGIQEESLSHKENKSFIQDQATFRPHMQGGEKRPLLDKKTSRKKSEGCCLIV